jgi:hypothetical protein
MPDTKKRSEGAFIGEKPVLKNTEWRETKSLCRKADIFYEIRSKTALAVLQQ